MPDGPFSARRTPATSRNCHSEPRVNRAGVLRFVLMPAFQFLSLVALRARAVADDFDGFVFLSFFHEAHQTEGVEEPGGDVGKGASALGGDAIADQEKQEFGEELVDFIGSMELRDLVEKFGGKVVRILFGCAETGMTEAEAELASKTGS